MKKHIFVYYFLDTTRSQAVARIADRTASKQLVIVAN